MGLVVVVDESEGYAFLRSKPDDPDDRRSPPIPRLIARHALSFHTSLMLALLRKKLAESDATDDGFRFILSRDQIVDMMVMFMPTSSNEARIVDIVDRTINKVVDLGFLRRMPKQDNQFEVRRVLKAFVDGAVAVRFRLPLGRVRRRTGGGPVTALFQQTDLDDPDADNITGFRLHRLEVLNWGTFDRRVWQLRVDGRNGLLTGDIGSGKSTLVDAVTTLLLPAHRIAYNKAAGAQARERDLRSYVLGYYKSERNEATGSSRPVGLRGTGTYSVVLGHFRNAGFNSDVTLAQVFSMKDGAGGQPDRFYVTTDAELSIAEHFTDFGSELPNLRRRLRKAGAARVRPLPRIQPRLQAQARDRFRTGHGPVPPDRVDEIGGRPQRVRPRSHARAVRRRRLGGQTCRTFRGPDPCPRRRREARRQWPAWSRWSTTATRRRLAGRLGDLHGQRDALRYYFAGLREQVHLRHVDARTLDLGEAERRLDATRAKLA